jgi:uncharacterized membrane protein YoaK (UPF0700 family)
VRDFWAGAIRTVSPQADARHGPLPLMLVGLTLVTGLVDAFSYLLLGHVFVANMTGNVVFLGFALAGAPGFSIASSLVALAAFWAGAFAGGALGTRLGPHRGNLLSATAGLEGVLFAVSVVLASVHESIVTTGYRYPLITLLAIALGLQNATARRLAVPDLTTTVLTLTITGTAADSVSARGSGSTAGRRVISVLSMFVGALVGALLVVHVRVVLPLVIGLAVLIAVALATMRLGRPNPAWVTP